MLFPSSRISLRDLMTWGQRRSAGPPDGHNRTSTVDLHDETYGSSLAGKAFVEASRPYFPPLTLMAKKLEIGLTAELTTPSLL